MPSRREEESEPLPLGESFFRRLLTKAHYEVWRVGALASVDSIDLASAVVIELIGMHERDRLWTTDPDDLLRGLVGRIVRRRAIDMARRAGQDRQIPAPHPDDGLVGSSVALDLYSAKNIGTTTFVRRLDARDQVTRILDFLATREREDPSLAGDYELFVMRLVEDLSYAEIARIRDQGENPEALRSKLRRLKRLIMEKFGKRWSG